MIQPTHYVSLTMKHFILPIACFLLTAIAPGSSVSLAGQSDEWRNFENTVLQLAENVVDTMLEGDAEHYELSSLENRVTALESLLALHIQQQNYPSVNACESMQKIVQGTQELLRRNPGGIFSREDGRKLIFLRQFIDYNASGHGREGETKQAFQAPEQLEFSIAYLHRPKNELHFTPLKNGDVMHSGDFYKIIFQPAENCVVYIFQSDASGKIYGLFPLETFRGTPIEQSNPAQMNRIYFVPDKDKSFRLDAQVGDERIYFLAFKEAQPELEALYREVVNAQDRHEPQKMREIQQKFLAHLESKGPAVAVTDPQLAELSFRGDRGRLYSVLRQRLEGMCDGCVNVLNVKHHP